MAQIYAVRRLLEPELAAGAVPHLTEEHFAALERSIETCAPHPASAEQALAQRQEDLHFHDVLAAAALRTDSDRAHHARSSGTRAASSAA